MGKRGDGEILDKVLKLFKDPLPGSKNGKRGGGETVRVQVPTARKIGDLTKNARLHGNST
jgi:hypothetical protein